MEEVNEIVHGADSDESDSEKSRDGWTREELEAMCLKPVETRKKMVAAITAELEEGVLAELKENELEAVKTRLKLVQHSLAITAPRPRQYLPEPTTRPPQPCRGAGPKMTMSPEDVAKWVSVDLELPRIAETFEKGEIGGEELLVLNREDLLGPEFGLTEEEAGKVLGEIEGFKQRMLALMNNAVRKAHNAGQITLPYNYVLK